MIRPRKAALRNDIADMSARGKLVPATEPGMPDSDQAIRPMRVLVVLFLANVLNFFDRAVPAILLEPIRAEWQLNDLQLGFIIAAFTLVYAGASVPLGLLADRYSRKTIIGCGLVAWSVFSALAAASSNFTSFLLTRVGVGIGEASYGPAATSLIGDLYPADRRSRAMGVFNLGLPLGLLLAFLLVGPIARAFDSWRAAFALCLLPGLIVAVFVFMSKEPRRGAAERPGVPRQSARPSLRTTLAVPTMRWILVAGVAHNFAAYATNAFMVPMIQRYFDLSLERAAQSTGVIVGLSGLVGLTVGGWIADYAHRNSRQGRMLMASICMGLSAMLTFLALLLDRDRATTFVAVFSLGWLLQYAFLVCVFPAIHDVIEPRMRATSIAVYFAIVSLLGGTIGPALVGNLSDRYALAAMDAAGASELTAAFRAVGLHDALMAVPLALCVAAAALFAATRQFGRDAAAMQAGLRSDAARPRLRVVELEAIA